MQQHSRPIWLGILLAVVFPAASLPLLTVFFGWSGSSILDTLLGASMLALATAIGAAPPTLILGLPFVLWLRSKGALNWLNVCVGAVAIGAFAIGLIYWAIQWGNPFPGLTQAIYGAVFGLIGGIGFCLGAGPNNSFKPKPLRGSA